MLDIYVDFLGLNPYTFFGVDYTTAVYRSNKIWTLEQRLKVLDAMEASRLQLEQLLGYHILPTYHAAERHVHTRSSIRLARPYIISLGTRQVEDLAPAMVDYATEPAKVLIPATVDNVHLYHPDTGKEIYVKARTFVDDVVTLYVPRYALVIDENNPVEGWEYDNLSNYLLDVEVKQVSYAAQTDHTFSPLNTRMGY